MRGNRETQWANLPFLSKQKRKFFARLHDKKFREKEKRFLAEGLRTVIELTSACKTEHDLVAIILRAPVDEATELPIDDKEKVFLAEKSDFDTLSATEQSQGVIGIFRQPEMSLTRALELVSKNTHSLVLLFDGIQDPGNAGTMVRTAAWFGADAIFASQNTVDFFNPKVVRASAGSLFSLPLIQSASLNQTVDQLKQNGFSIYAASPLGTSIWHVARTKKTALIIGNEANGVTPALFSKSDEQIRIPGNSHAVESLNASISAGILTAFFASR